MSNDYYCTAAQFSQPNRTRTFKHDLLTMQLDKKIQHLKSWKLCWSCSRGQEQNISWAQQKFETETEVFTVSDAFLLLFWFVFLSLHPTSISFFCPTSAFKRAVFQSSKRAGERLAAICRPEEHGHTWVLQSLTFLTLKRAPVMVCWAFGKSLLQWIDWPSKLNYGKEIAASTISRKFNTSLKYRWFASQYELFSCPL